MRIRKTLETALLAGAAMLLLSACENPMFEDTVFDREYLARQLPSEDSVLRSTSFAPRSLGVVQTYCYTTIGEVDCYAHPQDEQQYRLNGYFGPSPQ